MKNLTNDDQWKEGLAMAATHVFDRICMFSSTVVMIVKGLYQGSTSPQHSLE
jgi:hypothetical protein